MKNEKIRNIIGIIISIILLYFFLFKIINWDLFYENIFKYNFLFLIPGFILVLLNLYFSALRLKLILKPFKIIKTKIIFKAQMLSYFANLVLPINIGDLLRAYIIKTEEKIKYTTIFASIVVDRIYATLAILIMGFFLIFLIPIPIFLSEISQKIEIILKIVSIILIGIIILIYFLIKFQNTNFIKNKINKKYLKIINNFLKSIIYKRNFKEILILIFYSLIIRLLFATTLYVLVKGFGFNIPFYLFLFIDIFISTVVSLGQHLLGIIGTYETTLTYVLAFFGLSSEQGLFVALVSDIIYLLPVIIFGLYYFIKEDWNFTKIRNIKFKKLNF